MTFLHLLINRLGSLQLKAGDPFFSLVKGKSGAWEKSDLDDGSWINQPNFLISQVFAPPNTHLTQVDAPRKRTEHVPTAPTARGADADAALLGSRVLCVPIEETALHIATGRD